MGKSVLIVCFILLGAKLLSSQNVADFDNHKYVEVMGKAEIEYIPDEIKYSIIISDDNSGEVVVYDTVQSEKSIKEYQMQMKKRIEERYNSVWEILKSLGIDETAIVKDERYDFNSADYFTYEHKLFVVKFNNFVKFQLAVRKLKASNICNGQVIDAKTSKIKELEVNAKILAIEDAKQQAEKLAAAVGSKIGKVLQIKDPKTALENLNGDNVTGGWTVYPPLSALQNNYPSTGAIETNEAGKFILKQAITIRFTLIN